MFLQAAKTKFVDLSLANPLNSAHTRPSGFSLIELRVLFSIVGILASLLMPALARAKGQVTGVSCLNPWGSLTGTASIFNPQR